MKQKAERRLRKNVRKKVLNELLKAIRKNVGIRKKSIFFIMLIPLIKKTTEQDIKGEKTGTW